MNKRKIILIVLVILCLLTVSFFVFKNRIFKTKSNLLGTKNDIVINNLKEEVDTEKNDTINLKEDVEKSIYKRTYDRETHILTFYENDEKLAEVDLFKIAPISMEGRKNLGYSSYEAAFGEIIKSSDPKYSSLKSDNETFGTDEEIDSVILVVGVNTSKFYQNKYTVVNYNYYIYGKNDKLIGVLNRAIIFNPDGSIKKELAIREEMSDEYEIYIISVDNNFKYISYIDIYYIDPETDSYDTYHVISTKDFKKKENLLNIILNKPEYYKYKYLPNTSIQFFNKENSMKINAVSKDNFNHKYRLELNFDTMTIKVLNEYIL